MNTAGFLVFIDIYITVGFTIHFIMMSSNGYNFVIRNSCLLQSINGCFSVVWFVKFLLMISKLLNLTIFFLWALILLSVCWLIVMNTVCGDSRGCKCSRLLHLDLYGHLVIRSSRNLTGHLDLLLYLHDWASIFCGNLHSVLLSHST